MQMEMRLKQGIFLLMCGFAATVGMANAIADLCTGIALVIGIFLLKKERLSLDLQMAKPFLRAMGIFFFIYFLLIFASGDIALSAKAYWRYFNRMFPFFLVLFFIREPKRLCILFACAVGALFIDQWVVIYKGYAFFLQEHTFIRAAGASGDVIAQAGFMLIYLPVMILLLRQAETYQKGFLYALLLFTGGVALLFNGTRIAWVITLMILPVGIFLYGKNIKRWCFLFFIFYLAVGWMGYQVPFIQERLQSFADIDNISNKGHYSINMSAWNMIKDRPLLGHGLGFFPEVFNDRYISDETKRVEGHISHAHNDTLLMGAETGMIGILAFWWMFGNFLYFSLSYWRKERRIEHLMFFLVTLAAVLHGFTDTRFGMHQVMKLYFFLMAIYLNYASYQESEKLKE